MQPYNNYYKQDPWPDSVDLGEVVSGGPEGGVQVSRVEATAQAVVSAHRHLRGVIKYKFKEAGNKQGGLQV